VILDCRHDLARPRWGADAYAQGHIPGASFASLDHDLSGPITAASGRHPLPDRETFAATAGRWGIGPGTQVIAYDQGNGAFAARAWWLLRWMGHAQVAVLDGGFAAWLTAGLPATREPPRVTPRSFTGAPAAAAALDSETVQRELSRGGIRLIDARAADRFAGHNETIDPVAGHVPGARNHPFTQNLDAHGRFLPREALRERWLASLAGCAPERVVAMCGSGVTACHNLLALEIAGLVGARLYAGSWSEWIRDPSRGIERGVERGVERGAEEDSARR